MLSDSELDALRIRLDDARPALTAVVNSVVAQLKTEIANRGVLPAAVTGRVKDTASFVKKAFRKPYADPWADIHDKAAVRVTTVVDGDVATVQEAVEDKFRVVSVEDKRATLPPNLLGYLGVHLEVDPADAALPGELCEVQIRTAAQSAWADVSHHFLYKVISEVPADLQRALYRLLALVELFDLEVSRVREAIAKQPGYSEAQLLDTLEQQFLRLTAHSYDPELSTVVLKQLLPTLGSDPDHYGQTLAHFVEHHRDKLLGLYDDYLADNRHILMSQPESLLVFERLEVDPFTLAESWRSSLPESMLESLAAIWGKPIDVDQ
jgi:ppGpp synthetase/RelA/SpoT-type nucleotidyltranferase